MNDNLENFKLFVRNNPSFAEYIKDGSMTWQKFYELYDMYGEDSKIWDDYKNVTNKKGPTLNEIVNIAKKIDIDKLQEGVNSLSKAVGLFSDLLTSKNTNTREYKPRAIYKRFED